DTRRFLLVADGHGMDDDAPFLEHGHEGRPRALVVLAVAENDHGAALVGPFVVERVGRGLEGGGEVRPAWSDVARPELVQDLDDGLNVLGEWHAQRRATGECDKRGAVPGPLAQSGEQVTRGRDGQAETI